MDPHHRIESGPGWFVVTLQLEETRTQSWAEVELQKTLVEGSMATLGAGGSVWVASVCG